MSACGEFAQRGAVGAVVLRPQPDRGGGLRRIGQPGLRQGNERLALVRLGDAGNGLTDGHDLPGLGQYGGDDTVCTGPQLAIFELVAGQFERPARPLRTTVGFVARRLLAVVVGGRGEAVAAQPGIAPLVRRGLGQVRGGGGEFGLGTLHLQLEVGGVQTGDEIALAHPVAGVDPPLHDLAGDPEAEVRLVPRPDDPDEGARRLARLEGDAFDLHAGMTGSRAAASSRLQAAMPPAMPTRDSRARARRAVLRFMGCSISDRSPKD